MATEAQTPEAVVVSAQLVPANRARNGNVTVRAVMSDGSTLDLFSFYDDELHFSAAEFVGMTHDQACELKHRRDVAYLRS